MAEGAPLLREYTLIAYRGFESLLLRHLNEKAPIGRLFYIKATCPNRALTKFFPTEIAASLRYALISIVISNSPRMLRSAGVSVLSELHVERVKSLLSDVREAFFAFNFLAWLLTPVWFLAPIATAAESKADAPVLFRNIAQVPATGI